MSDLQINIPGQCKKLTAIVVRNGSNNQKVFHKYRNIDSKEAGLRSFLTFVSSQDTLKGEVIHINFYDKESKNFVCQWKK